MTARHDKATEVRIEAAAVDQAIADVEYAEGVLSRDPFDDTQRAHAAEMLRAALRVLADAVEELRARKVEPDDWSDRHEELGGARVVEVRIDGGLVYLTLEHRGCDDEACTVLVRAVETEWKHPKSARDPQEGA